jgi:guanosine-3',5'-bis(diphosphate) 3'-pyrophosphohydrolase
MHNAARLFAIAVHGDQKYGDDPYAKHLDAVAALAEPYGKQAVTVAYLHDAVEDTSATLAQIEQQFDPFIATCVGLLTDEPGPTRKERKAKTYTKMATVTGPTELALIVKAADRLANVRACIAGARAAQWEVYRSEHAAFHHAAYRAGLCDPLWAELQQLLADDARPAHEHRR